MELKSMIKAFQTVYNFWHFKRQTCERTSQSLFIKVLQWTLLLTKILYLGWLHCSYFFCYNKIWNGKVLPFDLKNFLQFGKGKSYQNCFTDLWLIDCQIFKLLLVCKLVLIEFVSQLAISFFTFTNEYILPIRLLS